MSSALDDWNPPKNDKPDYYDTVKFIYKYIEFHISEDEAYSILNAFIDKWDNSAGQLIYEEELVQHVTEHLRDTFTVLLPPKQIKRVVELIILYLRETGHYFKQEL
jgi:hypothetical protein